MPVFGDEREKKTLFLRGFVVYFPP